MKYVLLSVAMSALVFTGGCGLFKTEIDKCREKREYQQAQPAPRVQVPDDLEQLPEEARVPIPYGETNTEPTPPEDPCLIEPPDYR